MAERELDGRAAVVTGAAGPGIGAAIVAGLVRRGAMVLALDRSETVLEARREEWAGAGWPVEGEACDVRDEVAVASAIGRLTTDHRPSIVVNSAGLGALTPFEEVSAELWADLFAVNVVGAANVIRATLPMLVEAGNGAIVNVSSLAVQIPPERAPAYAASKAALNSLTRSIAIDYGPSGVRCNAVAPGPVRTPYVERHREAMEREVVPIPLGRLAEPDEIADVVCYLSSDRASFVSGQILAVSGGRPT